MGEAVNNRFSPLSSNPSFYNKKESERYRT
nr:MAG TPA: hypothetical protein [Crassvirales sp.]